MMMKMMSVKMMTEMSHNDGMKVCFIDISYTKNEKHRKKGEKQNEYK